MPDTETHAFTRRDLGRRDFVIKSGAALAGLTLLQACSAAQAFPSRPGEKAVPWADQPPENPIPQVLANQLRWEDFDSWITPNAKFFSVAHYDRPVIDAQNWRLEITGLVKQPMTLSLADLMGRPRQEVDYTLECSGNHGFPWFQGGIGTAHWAGTPLAQLLKEAGPGRDAIEVAFFGADSGEEIVRDIKMQQHFARSMTVEDAMKADNLLCYEMNGAPLPAANGAPLRLIAPGWYGIANVKWLTRIELRDRRLMNRFMARDYVTIREEKHDGESVWAETSVGPARIKSAPAKVTVLNGSHRIIGAAWGADIARVEVRVDDGPWQPATIEKSMGESAYTWKVWSMDWTDATSGEHTITSRAIAKSGEEQPAMDDPMIANKHTYWESNGYVTRHVRVA
jgi:DMSO/TMAO reductase YedYZ molybdopterin-dependent catalytic subunit